jgi:hypothetical protein
MKKLSLVVLGLLAMFLVTSCGGDDEEPNPPKLSFLTGDTIITNSGTVEPGATFHVRLQGIKGDKNLSTLTILQGQQNLNASFYTVTDFANNTEVGSTTNPVGLSGSARDAFTYTVSVEASATTGSYSYTFIVTDNDGETASLTTTLLVEESTSPIVTSSGKLINEPAGNGSSKAFYSISEATSYTYNTANADATLQSKIDFGYHFNGTAANPSSSDGSHFMATTVYTAGGTNVTTGWENTKATSFYKTSYSPAEFSAFSDDSFSGDLDFTSATTKITKLAEGDVLAVKKANGKVGLIHIQDISPLGTPSGTITINVKIQE